MNALNFLLGLLLAVAASAFPLRSLPTQISPRTASRAPAELTLSPPPDLAPVPAAPVIMSSATPKKRRPRPKILGSWRVDVEIPGETHANQFVVLFDDFSVSTALGSEVTTEGGGRGRWQVSGEEFSLVLDQPFNAPPWKYVGQVKKFASAIQGSVIEGEMDPCAIGSWKMTPVVEGMATDLKDLITKVVEEKESTTKQIYSKEALSGKWLVVCEGAGSGIFEVDLEWPSGNFETKKGMAGGKMRGRWNTFGPRLLLTVVKLRSMDAHMTADHHFWGHTIVGDGVTPKAIGGVIMEGELESFQIGTFKMIRPPQIEDEESE